MTRPQAIGWSVIAWAAVWAFWLATTRAFHANWPLAIIATTALIGAYAAAAYVNQLVLVPRFLRRGRLIEYTGWLMFIMLLLSALALGVIRMFYVQILGPFPVKPWYIDYGLDFTGMIVHVSSAALVVWFVRRKTQRGMR